MPASQWVSGQLVWAWTTLILVSITWVSEYIDNLGEGENYDDKDNDHTYDHTYES